MKDPFKVATPWWKKLLRILIVLVIVGGILFLTDNLGWAGLPRHKAEAVEPEVELIEEPVVELVEEPVTETVQPVEAEGDVLE